MVNHSMRIASVTAAVAIACAFADTSGAQEISGTATTVASPMSSNLVPVTQGMLDSAGAQTKNWIHSNGSYDNARFYAGDQINTANVGKLKPAFVFQTAVLESMETAPIVVNGVMFL
ncbi:MAG: quinonprotein alcohol dehydrogenase, partial [Casimicrobiaceae bacterium]